jgi:signal peptidase II
MTPRTRGLSVAALIFLADQVVKYLITVPLALKSVGQIVLAPIFNFTWVENYGVSLGMLTASSATTRWLLVAMTAGISLAVLLWLWREKNRVDVLALGFVLGGALGNMTDRVRFGHVVDFADLHFGDFRPFLVFNLADAAITVGVLILLARAFLARDPKPKQTESVDA